MFFTVTFIMDLPFSTNACRGRVGGGSSLRYISIVYYMQKRVCGEGVQIACKIAYVLNRRPPSKSQANTVIGLKWQK